MINNGKAFANGLTMIRTTRTTYRPMGDMMCVKEEEPLERGIIGGCCPLATVLRMVSQGARGTRLNNMLQSLQILIDR